MRRRGTQLAILAAMAALLAPAAARADTVTVGANLATPPDSIFAYGADTILVHSLPATAAAPTSGTVIGWSAYVDAGLPVRLTAMRPVSPTRFTVAAAGSPQNADGMGADELKTFTDSFPIRRGDAIGIALPDGDATLGAYEESAPPGARTLRFDIAPVVGFTTGEPDNVYENEQEAFNATIRFCKVPSLKGKTPKAARKALAKADCAVKVKKTKKQRKKKLVLSQSAKPGASISDTAAVTIRVSRKAPKKP